MNSRTFMRNGKLADQYGNQHQLTDELARGGQGVVYRTTDADLAVKQPVAADGEVDRSADLQAQIRRFLRIRCLPLPPRIPISLPLAVLRDEPGYVMSLLSEMEPFSAFELRGNMRDELARAPIPGWLAGSNDKSTALLLMHYAKTGSTKRRLRALAKAAAILARLHAAGLVYGDISPNNCFMSQGESQDVWLIDADNLRLERIRGGGSVYTPRYGAPEVVQGTDQTRPRSDAWAFAVMAFETLALVHPFIGQKILDPNEDAGGWDAEPVTEGAPADLDEQAYAGYFPFVDDEYDESNRAVSGLPRKLILTPQLARLFQETFGAGRAKPWRRPAMAFWALELSRAHDMSVVCPDCAMTYLLDHTTCPYCDTHRPRIVVAATDRWQVVLEPRDGVVLLPHRLFHPFSLELNGSTQYEAVLDYENELATHARGTDPLPTGLSFQFLKGEVQ